jgi:hypothetical protein
LADDVNRQEVARRRGRTAGIVLFAVIVTAFTAICSVEIIVQAWAAPPGTGQVECRTGLSDLIRALRRARGAAAEVTGGEREAVAKFRASLEPEWAARPGLTDRCAGDRAATHALGDIDRLRYAEEHALRYEALDVASRRRRVDAIERDLGGQR